MSEDAISRQAAINAILTKYTEYERLKMLHFTPNIIKQECADLLTDLPPVTPKQRTGHWIKRYIIGKRNIEMIVCSECGEEFSYDAETGVSHYDYCPNCGAKMEEQA